MASSPVAPVGGDGIYSNIGLFGRFVDEIPEVLKENMMNHLPGRTCSFFRLRPGARCLAVI